MDSQHRKALNNLVAIHQLHKEPYDSVEFTHIVETASLIRKDSQVSSLCTESQFTLVYRAAHMLSLAALRWYGYRADSRHLVFQTLQHTLELPATQLRVFDTCHHRNNVTENQGHLNVDAALFIELSRLTASLEIKIKQLIQH